MTERHGVIEIPRQYNPFPMTGVSWDSRGIPHYDYLPETLLDLLAERVATRPDSEAVIELGADRVTYRQLWQRAARVAGGLHAAGLRRGERVGLRYPAGPDWVLAFWGTLMAGGVPVAVNTRSAAPEIEFVLSDAGVKLDLPPGTPLPDGKPYLVDGLERTDIAGLLLHLRDHRASQGGAYHPRGLLDQRREHSALHGHISGNRCGTDRIQPVEAPCAP